LSVDLLHGDRFPRLSRLRGNVLPGRKPVPGVARTFFAGAPFRLRSGRVVLALRRRGLAVPVRLHLLVGQLSLAAGTGTMAAESYPAIPSTRTALTMRCPRCGRGRLFAGFLTVAQRCGT